MVGLKWGVKAMRLAFLISFSLLFSGLYLLLFRGMYQIDPPPPKNSARFFSGFWAFWGFSVFFGKDLFGSWSHTPNNF